MTFLIVAILAPIALVTLVFTVELLVGLPALRPASYSPAREPITIVIPAHDEELILGATLAAIKQAAGSDATILVVADNCVDGTAECARAAGVEVIKRHDDTRRGTGFALSFARDHLRENPPATVIVLDADCATDHASITALAAAVITSGRPCQAVNLLRPVTGKAPLVRLSTFAFMVKNLVRQRALQRLAGRVHLTGTGMAIPWRLFAEANLATASIVEDVKLGLELDRNGHPPMLVPTAVVWSDPAPQETTLVQRQRWEGGFLAMATRTAPAALGRSLRRGDLRGLWAALDLCVPPLTLLLLLNLAALLLGAGMTWVSEAQWWPLALHATLFAAAGLALALAWWREGRQFISLGGLLQIPLYVAWKIPMYLGLSRKGSPNEWLRTGR